ncbi:hypothetical protein EON67_05545 [archaeon]|nr:MAG: hypothetical protein EON67_05545 [archaeon]
MRVCAWLRTHAPEKEGVVDVHGGGTRGVHCGCARGYRMTFCFEVYPLPDHPCTPAAPGKQARGRLLRAT